MSNTKKYYERGLRYDGRVFDALRSISVEYGVSRNAEGSARVTLGTTIVYAGVKMALEKPYDDTPDRGNLMVNAELTPLASPAFETGPPSDWAIEISRLVDRTIREGHAVDFSHLCIEEGEKVWSVMIDIVPVNDGGNLLDAASIAALAALKDARFPTLTDGKVSYKQKGEAFTLTDMPLLATVYKIADHLVVDPDYEEEVESEGRVSFAVREDGTFCGIQKGLAGAFSHDEIITAAGMAQETVAAYRKAIR